MPEVRAGRPLASLSRRHRRRALAAAAVAALPLVAAVPGNAGASTSPAIQVLSNRADLVSGGDALVEVAPSRRADLARLRIVLNGQDVTSRFAIRPNGRYQALLTDLRVGRNELTARAPESGPARLTITNHPKQGPVFAGRQVQPWNCETEAYGLGPASGPGCEAPTRYDLFYKSAETNQFLPYDKAAPPAESAIAKTTTDEGVTTPYVVRRERGVLDRGIYDIAVLVDPAKPWSPWDPQRAWNRKLHVFFSGGAMPSHRQAGSGVPDVLGGGPSFAGDLALSRGFAVASSSLFIGNNSVNDIVQAEALTMLKEHVIESYGQLRYTTSTGASGGSIPQFVIADNYPGLLDGIMPTLSAPDWATWAGLELTECVLLSHYFENAPAELWADSSARLAVTGGPSTTICGTATGYQYWDEIMFNPGIGCTSGSGPEPPWVYDAQANPTGVRCTVQDYMPGVYGTRSSDGFAARPVDNVGVQYGLAALREGKITREQFVDLNARIGGRDIDNTWTPSRTRADRQSLRAAYQTGRVAYGRQLAKVPIVDLGWPDATDLHAKVRPQMMYERLVAVNGQGDNMVRWHSNDALTATDPMAVQAFLTLDAWVARVTSDTSRRSLEAKVLRHKPVEAEDTCWQGGKPGAACPPAYSRPRIVAGGPVASDVLKCQLEPIDWDDYSRTAFTSKEKRELRAAFPHGVCDWTKRGVEQQRPKGTWLSFMSRVGGAPLGPEPRSTP